MSPKSSPARPASGSLTQSALSLESLIASDFKPLAGKSVLIVGDLILDHCLWGSVERTTPEAPVPIVRHERDTWGLGGAANVAHNVTSLGGKAFLVGTIGRDEAGVQMLSLLKKAGIDTSGVVSVEGRPTTLKTRVMSMGQQLLRIDREETGPLDDRNIEKLTASVCRLAGKCGAALLSDYAKGVLGPEVIAASLAEAHRREVPVLVDPKGQDYSKYRGADLLTPNLREATLAVGHPIQNDADLERAGRQLIRQCGLQAIVITLGPEGMAIIRPRGAVARIPARAREVFDVTGAGDTTIATLTLGLAAGLPLSDAAALANHAGGIVVGKLGVAAVTPQELKNAVAGGGAISKIRSIEELKGLLANQQSTGRKVVFTNGCFDLLHTGHIRFLHEARRLGDILVVGLNTDRSVRAVKGASRPILPQEERAAILSALEVVDYVVFFDDLTPEPLLEGLRPDILVKGDTQDHVVGREIVENYGGVVRQLRVQSGVGARHLASIVEKCGDVSPEKKASKRRSR